MPTDLDRTREEFTKQAPTLGAAPAFHADRAVEPFVRLLGTPLPSPILDLACGPGIVSAAVAGAGARVMGLDATPAMVAAAETRCGSAGLTRASFREGTAESLPFESASFGGAVTRLSLHHFSAPELAIAELRRVLQPGAPLVIGDIVSSPVAHEAALHDALERLRDPSHVHCLGELELTGSIEAAGFTIDVVEAWDNPRSFDEWAAIVEAARSIEPLRVVMAALADSGAHAGIDLRSNEGQVGFVHRWRFVRATSN
jgi:SAM-dependent methyltransferase